MATRKSKAASKAASPVSTATTPSSTRTRRRARATSRAAAETSGSVRRTGRPATNLFKYVTPGVAALASTAVAAIGYVFKDQVGNVAADVVRSAAKRGRHAMDATRDQAGHAVDKFADELSWDTLLRHAGLQRRSMLSAIVGPAIGVACGVVAGSMLTFFYGPKLLDHFADKKVATSSDAPVPDETAPRATAPSADGGVERMRPNGGLHGGVS
jgi:hypothetical protein